MSRWPSNTSPSKALRTSCLSPKSQPTEMWLLFQALQDCRAPGPQQMALIKRSSSCLAGRGAGGERGACRTSQAEGESWLSVRCEKAHSWRQRDSALGRDGLGLESLGVAGESFGIFTAARLLRERARRGRECSGGTAGRSHCSQPALAGREEAPARHGSAPRLSQ